MAIKGAARWIRIVERDIFKDELFAHIVSIDPVAELDGTESCFFCNSLYANGHVIHSLDCLWVRAKELYHE